MLTVLDAAQFIDHCEARVFAMVIQRGNIDEIIKAQFIFCKCTYLGDAFGLSHADGDFATKFLSLRDQIPEFCLKL